MAELIVSVDTLAEMLSVTPRRVQQLAKEGIFPRASQGRYDAVTCVSAYIRRIGGGTDPVSAKRLREDLMAAKLEAQRLENEATKGTLIGKAGAERIMFTWARGLRDAILNFPVRTSAQIGAELGVPAVKVNAVLERKLKLLLTDLADRHPPEISPPSKERA